MSDLHKRRHDGHPTTRGIKCGIYRHRAIESAFPRNSGKSKVLHWRTQFPICSACLSIYPFKVTWQIKTGRTFRHPSRHAQQETFYAGSMVGEGIKLIHATFVKLIAFRSKILLRRYASRQRNHPSLIPYCFFQTLNTYRGISASTRASRNKIELETKV